MIRLLINGSSTPRKESGDEMFTRWVTIHESYGLPRAAQECRHYLEIRGISVRLRGESRGSLYYYWIQVPQHQQKLAVELMAQYKQGFA